MNDERSVNEPESQNPEIDPAGDPSVASPEPAAVRSAAADEPSEETTPRSGPGTLPGEPGRREPEEPDDYSKNIKRILDIHLPVTVSFGVTRRSLQDVLKLSPGSLIELDKSAEDPVVLKINDKPFAWGKVVDVDGYYGVEITEILTQADRIVSLGGD